MALENPLECLRKGFEKALEGLRDAFGTLLEALGRLWGVFGGLGCIWDGLSGGFVHLRPAPWGAQGGLGRPWGTLWDAFGALEDFEERQNIRLLERCHVDMRSKQILVRFYNDN